MFVAMSRDAIGCRSQFNLIGSLSHHTSPGFHSGEYLYTFSIVCAKSHQLFPIPLFVQLQVDEETALFLCKCAVGQGDDVLHR